MKRASLCLALGSAATLALVASCSGKAVIDPTGGGGAAGGNTTTTSTTSTSTSTSTTATTTALCTSHDECEGDLCIFATGQCAPGCVPESCDSCGAGVFCEPCATSSCPGCLDCAAACVPAIAGRCDEDDPCPGELVCQWSWGSCLPPCSNPGEQCGGFAYCDECATSSCCGCADCVSACLGGE